MMFWVFLCLLEVLQLCSSAPLGSENQQDDIRISSDYKPDYILVDSANHVIKIYPFSGTKTVNYEHEGTVDTADLDEEEFSTPWHEVKKKESQYVALPLINHQNNLDLPKLPTTTRIVYTLKDGEFLKRETIKEENIQENESNSLPNILEIAEGPPTRIQSNSEIATEVADDSENGEISTHEKIVPVSMLPTEPIYLGEEVEEKINIEQPSDNGNDLSSQDIETTVVPIIFDEAAIDDVVLISEDKNIKKTFIEVAGDVTQKVEQKFIPVKSETQLSKESDREHLVDKIESIKTVEAVHDMSEIITNPVPSNNEAPDEKTNGSEDESNIMLEKTSEIIDVIGDPAQNEDKNIQHRVGDPEKNNEDQNVFVDKNSDDKHSELSENESGIGTAVDIVIQDYNKHESETFDKTETALEESELPTISTHSFSDTDEVSDTSEDKSKETPEVVEHLEESESDKKSHGKPHQSAVVEEIKIKNLETQKRAAAFMAKFNRKSAKEANKATIASWAFASNITEYNKNLSIQAKEEFARSVKLMHGELQEWKDIVPLLTDETLKRQFKNYDMLGSAILPEKLFLELTKLKAELQNIYSTAQICDFKNSSNCNLSLEPDLATIFKKSRNFDELTYVWKAWRDASGKKMKKLYEKSVKLGNEAARLNGFKTMTESWNQDYEDDNFEKEVAGLFKILQPLYDQLHAYTRRKLREVYGEDKVSKTGPIPAQLLGNMWSQSWTSIYDILIPYPGKTSVDVTDTMIKQGFTPKIMFEKADDFFGSLGLKKVSPSFWKKSIIERPENRKLVCHASAWDFSDGKDFRIKQCTIVTMDDFFTVHHELGHIQYYMQYYNLPHALRAGANPGFHEAVGDLISLSVSTPKHLYKVGLLGTLQQDYESDINFLLLSALQSVSFLPFGYLVDQWRWDVFRGLVTPENYTCAWWDYRYKLQGIKAPVQRSELDFDPGAKFHVAGFSRYISYFVSRILTFQFHKTVCSLANEYEVGNPEKPLHKCDIHQSKAAGQALGDMLRLGSSQNWRKTLESFTGTPNMEVEPLIEYFKPLMDWLAADNKKHNEFIGWKGENDFCTRS